MQNKYIALFLGSFLMLSASVAAAEQLPVAAPATMSDEALASYITGRLKLVLTDEGRTVDQHCDASGCAVVVQ